MGGILETAGKLLDTPQKREIAHRGLNLVLAIAAFNTLNHAETLSAEFCLRAFSLCTFAYEAISPNINNRVAGFINGAAASSSFFSNPLNTGMHVYNAARRAINVFEDAAEEYRSEAGYTN